jgi:uncharacterized membrane protein
VKGILEFLKTTLAGGLLVLLPLCLFYLFLAELLQIVVLLATPIADLFPAGTFEKVELPVVIAVLLIVAASFVFGLALRSEFLRRVGRAVDDRLLRRLPLYRAIQSLSRGLVSSEDDAAFQSGLLRSPEGDLQVVYVIEDHGDGRLTVLLPFAPASFSGVVKIVDRDRVEQLRAGIGDASRVVANWGVGSKDLLGE